jgi:hypothetical protein
VSDEAEILLTSVRPADPNWPSLSGSTWYTGPVYGFLEVADDISDKHFPVMPHSLNTDVIKAFENVGNGR